MEDLDKEYTLLFNGITDAIREMEGTVARLKALQVQAEDVFIARRERGFDVVGSTGPTDKPEED